MAKLDLAKTAWVVFVFCAATALTSPATTTFTTLVSFDGTNGAYPEYMSLVQGTNGNFYGTTSAGGANGYGTVFSLSVGLGPFVETWPTFGKVGATVIILGTNLTRDQRQL